MPALHRGRQPAPGRAILVHVRRAIEKHHTVHRNPVPLAGGILRPCRIGEREGEADTRSGSYTRHSDGLTGAARSARGSFEGGARCSRRTRISAWVPAVENNLQGQQRASASWPIRCSLARVVSLCFALLCGQNQATNPSLLSAPRQLEAGCRGSSRSCPCGRSCRRARRSTDRSRAHRRAPPRRWCR